MLPFGFLGAFLWKLVEVASKQDLGAFIAHRFCIFAPTNVIVELLEKNRSIHVLLPV